MCDKIYVVTKGEYSDYHIVGCFTNREMAEKYSGRDSYIEEYEANPDSDKLNEGLRFYSSSMDMETGDLRGCGPATKDERSCMKEEFFISFGHSKEKGTTRCLFGRAWAKSRDHMIKITSDKRREVLALGEHILDSD